MHCDWWAQVWVWVYKPLKPIWVRFSFWLVDLWNYLFNFIIQHHETTSAHDIHCYNKSNRLIVIIEMKHFFYINIMSIPRIKTKKNIGNKMENSIEWKTLALSLSLSHSLSLWSNRMKSKTFIQTALLAQQSIDNNYILGIRRTRIFQGCHNVTLAVHCSTVQSFNVSLCSSAMYSNVVF